MSIYANLIRRKALLCAILLLMTFCNASQMDQLEEGPLPYNDYIRQLYSGLNSTEHPEVTSSKHPIVEALVMPLCHQVNTRKGGICMLDDLNVLYRSDVIIDLQTINVIYMKDSQLRCKRTNGIACKITISLNKTGETYWDMRMDSTIQGSHIMFDSPTTNLIVDSTSFLNVNGRSLVSRGSAVNRGASYIAQGGSCGTPYLANTYGKHNMMPTAGNLNDMQNNQLLGSVGESNPLDPTTAGGGFAYLNLNSIHLNGTGNQIQANGIPSAKLAEDVVSDLNGGTGGYIYINTQNQYTKNNIISSGAVISAIGGYGKNKGFGGAGGVVVFGKHFRGSTFDVKVHGGGTGFQYADAKPEGCGNGGAGTVYMAHEDMLRIDNDGIITNKFTRLYGQRQNQIDFKNEFMLAENTIISEGTQVEINNGGISSFMFPTLTMEAKSQMRFNIPIAELTLKYRKHFVVHPSTVIDFTPITQKVEFVSTSEDTLYNIVNLGSVLFNKFLKISVSQLTLNGNILDPKDSPTRETTLQFFANSLVVKSGANILADKIVMFSNDTFEIENNSVIKSTKPYECTTDKLGNKDLYECMDLEFESETINATYLVNHYNQQFNYASNSPYFAKNPSDMGYGILKKWNVYLLSLGQFEMQGSAVQAPRVGICANNLDLIGSKVKADGLGCPAQKGVAPGTQVGMCSASGGAHGGAGGYGGAETRDPQQMAQCLRSFPEPYYFGEEARYEGSGGGNGNRNYNSDDTGGQGGGIIWLSTPGTTDMRNSTISSNGQWGLSMSFDQLGAGGGAGGSIQLTTLNLRGNGFISARGGMGSSNGGGGGAGGRLVMNYLKSYLANSQPNQSFYWTGSHDVTGGPAGDMNSKYQQPKEGGNGTMLHSKCFPGYSGVFCKPCEIGEFKYDYSYGKCMACQNKPRYSYYTKMGEDTSICEYQCDRWLEKVDQNLDCLDPISLQIQREGGLVPGFAMFGLYLLISLIIFSFISHRSEQIYQNLKDLHETLYMAWEEEDTAKRGMASETDFSFKDENIWCHTHRMYLIGFNSISYPWFIPKDFPRDTLKKVDREKFLRFIDEYNDQMRFTFGQRIAFVLTRIFFPPLSKFVHTQLRKQKFIELQKNLFRAFSPQFWMDKEDNKSMRLSCSTADYRLAYIDFIDFKKRKENWLGLKLPMTVLLAGSGTFNTPYNLDFVNDTFAKSLVLIKFEYFLDKLPIFFENFNSQLAKLSFYKLETQVLRDLGNVVAWLEKANRAMFNHFNIKCVLYIIENQYTEVEGGVFKQKRRSFPLETIFFEAFPEMYRTLLSYLKAKLISNKSEIRLCLVFKRFSKSRQISQELRVSTMMANDAKSAYQIAVHKQESVLFDDKENDKSDEQVTYADRTGKLPQLDETVDTMNQTAESVVSGDTVKTVKLVDKSRRAFSVSIESTKAFEIAIRKPRNKAKHIVTKIRASFYGLFLLLVKHHGKPPTGHDLTGYFVFMAAIVGLDIMVLINFTYHIFLPPTNFEKFGFAFFFLYPLIPILSPIFAITSAVVGSPTMLRTVGNLNATMIMFNIPLTMLFAYQAQDDPQYLLLLVVMIFIKVAISGISAKVLQNLINPRYAKNQEKLKTILSRQAMKVAKREEIIGKEISQQLEGIGIATTPVIDPSTQEQMREYLLEK